jgi:hypothetical protein
MSDLTPKHGPSGDRKRSILATSEKARQAYLQRRGEPLVLGDDVKPFGVRRMPYKDLLKLRIDLSYQREEVTDKVNELIHVIREGGVIPDPITVAQRPDNTLYIVDGQQRWWAAIDTETSLEVKIMRVANHDAEVKLFHVLNNKATIAPRHVIRSWPGKCGDVLRLLATSSASALQGQIDFSASGVARAPATSMVRGLVTLVGGATGGGVTRSLQSFDFRFEENPQWTMVAAFKYAEVVASIFDSTVEGTLRSVVAVALARLCRRRWRTCDPTDNGDGWAVPTRAQYEKLQKIGWQKLVPTPAMKWAPVVEAEIRKAWPHGKGGEDEEA